MSEPELEEADQDIGSLTYDASLISSVKQNASISTPTGRLTTKGERLGKRESVRSKIALRFIYAFFAFLFFTMIIGLLKGYFLEDFKELLVTVSGILSGPLGFIIGFYFKDTIE